MLWVIVVHVLYWGYFFGLGRVRLLQSFLLFEMPLFFFVTGASNGFSATKGYFNFVFKRYKRILVPYWVFAAICACISIVFYKGNLDAPLITKIALSWFIPVDRQISSVSYLSAALWFVPVYLCVVLAIPLLKRAKASKNAIFFFFTLVILFFATCAANLGWIKNVAFYSIWTYVGLYYNDFVRRLNQKGFRWKIALVSLTGAVAVVALHALGVPLDMQLNKFPPNIAFGFFSMASTPVVLLNLRYIDKAFALAEKNALTKKMADLFSTRSMTIFLYQSFAFKISVPLAYMLVPGSGFFESALRAIFCFVATVPLCALFASVFGRIEAAAPKVLLFRE